MITEQKIRQERKALNGYIAIVGREDDLARHWMGKLNRQQAELDEYEQAMAGADL